MKSFKLDQKTKDSDSYLPCLPSLDLSIITRFQSLVEDDKRYPLYLSFLVPLFYVALSPFDSELKNYFIFSLPSRYIQIMMKLDFLIDFSMLDNPSVKSLKGPACTQGKHFEDKV